MTCGCYVALMLWFYWSLSYPKCIVFNSALFLVQYEFWEGKSTWFSGIWNVIRADFLKTQSRCKRGFSRSSSHLWMGRNAGFRKLFLEQLAPRSLRTFLRRDVRGKLRWSVKKRMNRNRESEAYRSSLPIYHNISTFIYLILSCIMA